MIRIHRGPEPEAIRDERYVRLAQAEIANEEKRAITFAGYDVARQKLYEAQNNKCAYCEMQALEAGLPVEHFRPKNGAVREGGSVDEDRYFWLAWTWENLWFSCGSCNCPARNVERAEGTLRGPIRELTAAGSLSPTGDRYHTPRRIPTS